MFCANLDVKYKSGKKWYNNWKIHVLMKCRRLTEKDLACAGWLAVANHWNRGGGGLGDLPKLSLN